MKTVLITGSNGFIGFHLSQKLLSKGYKVIGIDNEISSNEDSNKVTRYNLLKGSRNFSFNHIDIRDLEKLNEVFENNHIDSVIHLAGKSSVRDSNKMSQEYLEINILGYHNILDLSQKYNVKSFLYASSSSVYGDSAEYNLKLDLKTDSPKSIYAMTKKTNELLAYTYSNLYKMTTVGLRFFTTYGELGRENISIMSFCKSAINNAEITINGDGSIKRDYIYIKDLVDGIYQILLSESIKGYNIFNLGTGQSYSLKETLSIIEEILKKRLQVVYTNSSNLQDVLKTQANIAINKELFSWEPKFTLREGLSNTLSSYL